ncbi:MAG TPA: thiol peroxidase [Flavobacteriales bacterium]|jgi:thiol peroxidase|nr:thiol peroxidase [Flavobacteriales bacterium]MBP8878146.1 thiol peroxidase [Flavobacteriales bacterium]MCC6911388.1 thiol peroxidase [Flavobacteriales bacterium]HQW06757.1 thiol peroxidase [Flavobacteriales bacterium]HQW98811.1 thiol peroxidase [Flavobacteriales bacterium]
MAQPAFHGPLPQVGTTAPTLRYVNKDRQEGTLADLKGDVVLLIAFPSVDTAACALETRTFNQRAVDLGAKVLSISMDLPFALGRFCAAEGIENVLTGSDFRYHDAAHVWGAAITEGVMAGTLGRITWVIDKAGVIQYLEVTPELGGEPDYDRAIEAVKRFI